MDPLSLAHRVLQYIVQEICVRLLGHMYHPQPLSHPSQLNDAASIVPLQARSRQVQPYAPEWLLRRPQSLLSSGPLSTFIVFFSTHSAYQDRAATVLVCFRSPPSSSCAASAKLASAPTRAICCGPCVWQSSRQFSLNLLFTLCYTAHAG
ncbi:hypothetical protein CC2G_006951 [Coprinopsis cinerea AmutBmut pab1-1]|nr:hypothetical protein CC2G_006951 [Coprinopsis cinerea AmutBmut pab1-1]